MVYIAAVQDEVLHGDVLVTESVRKWLSVFVVPHSPVKIHHSPFTANVFPPHLPRCIKAPVLN